MVPVTLIAAVTTLVAAKIKKPVTQWTCADFLSVDDQFKPKVIYSPTAFAKGGKPAASRDRYRGNREDDSRLVDDCTREPKASFWQRVKDEWNKVESEAKKAEKKL